MKTILLGIFIVSCLGLSACNKTSSLPSTADYIGIAAAKEEALKAAGTSSDQLFLSSAELTDRNGVSCYEIIFSENDAEHIYEIDALTGTVIGERHRVSQPSEPALPESLPTPAQSISSSESDFPQTPPQPTAETQTPQSAAQTPQAAAQTPQTAAGTPQTNASTSSNNKEIDSNTALSIALNHAGLTTDSVSFYNTKTDMEDGQKVFEVEFIGPDGTEYDYEIYASNGTIRKYDIETKSTGHPSSSPTTELISESQAKQIVLDRVPGASAANIVIHLERDDGQTEYEGKLIYNNTEYEFKINAATGTVTEWEVETKGR